MELPVQVEGQLGLGDELAVHLDRIDIATDQLRLKGKVG